LKTNNQNKTIFCVKHFFLFLFYFIDCLSDLDLMLEILRRYNPNLHCFKPHSQTFTLSFDYFFICFCFSECHVMMIIEMKSVIHSFNIKTIDVFSKTFQCQHFLTFFHFLRNFQKWCIKLNIFWVLLFPNSTHQSLY